MARVYAVASSKGGVGKTTTTANLSATLAAAGYDVAVVDGDIGMANLGNQLGVDVDGATLHDVLGGRATVEEATYEGPHGLAVVPGDTALTAFSDADVTKLGTVLGSFADRDFVFVDTGAGLSHETALPVGLADEVILVSTADRDALGDTDKTRELAGRLGVPVAGVVLTRVAQTPDDAGPLDAEILGAVPEDTTIRQANDAGTPVTLYDPDSPAAAAYRGVAGAIADGPVRPPLSEGGSNGAGEGTGSREGDESATKAVAEAEAEDEVEVEAESEPVPEPETVSASDEVAIEPEPEPKTESKSTDDAEPATVDADVDADTDADEPDAIPDAEGGTVEVAETADVATEEPDAGDDEAIPFSGDRKPRNVTKLDVEDDDEDDDENKGFLGRLFG